MPVPKGVNPGKYDRCVEQVKEKQKDKVNPWAVCSSRLGKNCEECIKQQQTRHSPLMDQPAYRQCVTQLKQQNASNPWTQCKSRLGIDKSEDVSIKKPNHKYVTGAKRPYDTTAPVKQRMQDMKEKISPFIKSELEPGMSWGQLKKIETTFQKPYLEPVNLIDTVSRKEKSKKEEDEGQKKVVASLGEAQLSHKQAGGYPSFKSELESGMSWNQLKKRQTEETLRKPKK